MPKHPLDTMTTARANHLMTDRHAQLTPEEIAAGYVFCCEWDGMLIHASHVEADCCSCLREFRQKHNIEDQNKCLTPFSP